MLSSMKRCLMVLLTVSLAGSAMAFAQTGPVELGVGGGVAVPVRSDGGPWETTLTWGFHVNIPIIPTLHISPSSEIYRADGIYATDVALGFKLLIPLRALDIFIGVAPGLTAAGSEISANAGILGGVTVPLVSNVGGFVQYRYKVLFRDGTGARFSHLTAGLLFAF